MGDFFVTLRERYGSHTNLRYALLLTRRCLRPELELYLLNYNGVRWRRSLKDVDDLFNILSVLDYVQTRDGLDVSAVIWCCKQLLAQANEVVLLR